MPGIQPISSLVYNIPDGLRYPCNTYARAVRIGIDGMLYTSPVGRLIHHLVSNYSWVPQANLEVTPQNAGP